MPQHAGIRSSECRRPTTASECEDGALSDMIAYPPTPLVHQEVVGCLAIGQRALPIDVKTDAALSNRHRFVPEQREAYSALQRRRSDKLSYAAPAAR